MAVFEDVLIETRSSVCTSLELSYRLKTSSLPATIRLRAACIPTAWHLLQLSSGGHGLFPGRAYSWPLLGHSVLLVDVAQIVFAVAKPYVTVSPH